MKPRRKFQNYWEKSVPWTFRHENVPYLERRKLRYDLQDYMQAAIPFTKYRLKLVLELGSGGGIDSAEFGRNGAKIVSVDFTVTGTEVTRDTMRDAGVIPNVVRADVLHLPFRPDTFECVYSFGVVHHVPEVGEVLTEITRVLKRYGDLICMLYNKESLLYAYSIQFLHRTEGKTEEELLRFYSERRLGCPYTKAYTKNEAKRLLKSFFDKISTKIFYNVIDLPDYRKFKLNIPNSYELGWHMIVRCKKRDRR